MTQRSSRVLLSFLTLALVLPSLTAATTISTKFTLGDRVVVTTGPLNVRVSAGGSILGKQPQGAFGTIIAGPALVNGRSWWKVDYDSGVDGWSYENYLSKAPTYSFSVGMRISVYNATVSVRSGGGTTETVLGTQAANSLGTIVGGPVVANGYTWWNINFDSGVDGWSVQNYLIPLSVLTTAALPTPTTLTLANLPPTSTTATNASISYSLSGSGTVYCRLDAYSPIVCPNPFQLGATTPLTAGTHSADFYVDQGSGIPSTPTKSYSWSITGTVAVAAVPAPTTSALPSAFTGISSWGIDAPDDTDQAAWVASGLTFGDGDGSRGFSEKGYSNTITSLSQLPTITNSANGGGTRFGPVTVDGVPAILKNIRQGDALRYQGNRSGLVYDGFQVSHGHDYWIAYAFKLGTEWVAAKSGGHGDRAVLFDVHQQQATWNAPASLEWYGDSGKSGEWNTGKELWWSVVQYDNGSAAYLYNEAATPGQWMRVITHYRSGTLAQGPVLDVWVANGNGAYRKLQRTVDPYTGTVWTNTPAFGDPLTNTIPQFDYPKFEIYKWTTGAYGNIPNRSVWTSGLFMAEGANLYDQAVAAVAPYAIGAGGLAPTPPTPTPPSPSLTLSNLPPTSTTATNASISYTLSGSGTVYCRLDTYSPIVCPNPFALGATTPLSAGTHSVDFYVDQGSGIPATATKSYSWSITAPAVSTPTFTIGQRISATANLNVRVTANTTGTLLGTEAIGALGTIVGGPIAQGGYTWWQINYDNGMSGWSVDAYLTPSSIPAPVSLTLSNLPPTSTTQTSASIGYTLSGSGTVYCRLDTYSPIVCPNPFALGLSPNAPLSSGTHSVDFYVDQGSGIPATATKSYSWSISGSVAVALAPAPSGNAPILLASVNAGQPFASVNSNVYVQMLGGSQPVSGVSEYTGVVSTNATSNNGSASTIPGPYGSTYMRFGKVPDPLNSSRSVFMMGANSNDVPTYMHPGRVELSFSGVQLAKSGVTYWAAAEVYIPNSRWPGGSAGASNGNLLQLHTSSLLACSYGGPWGLFLFSGGYAPNAGVGLLHLYDMAPSCTTDSSVRSLPYTSNNAPFGPFTTDAWHKVIVRWKGDPTGTTGTMALWIDGTQMVNETGIQLGPNVESSAYDYLKSGFDDYNNGGGTGTYQLLRSFFVVQDAGYTFDQVNALLQ